MAKAAQMISSDPDGTFSQNAGLMIHIRLGEMMGFATASMDESRADELHAMRIAAKRLRYTLEIFEPCFGGPNLSKEYKFLYGSVKSIQELIGQIHDCDYRLPLLHEFVTEHGKRRPEIKIGLERLIEREQDLRAKLYAQFVEYWAKLGVKGFRRRFEAAILAVSLDDNGAGEAADELANEHE